MSEARSKVYDGLKRFSDDEDKIGLVILELGEDPDANEYPDGTLQRGLEVFQAMGAAATKVLEAGSIDNSAIAVQKASVLAAELLEDRGINFPPDVVMVLAQAALEEGTQLARDLTNLKEAALVAGLKSGNQQLTQKLIQSAQLGHSVTSEVFSPESIQVMVESVTPALQAKQPDAKAFLASLDEQRRKRNQVQQEREEQAKALPKPNPKQLVAAFLAARKS